MKLSLPQVKLQSELKRTNERINEIWKKGKQYGMEIYNKYVERLATAENVEKGLVHFTKDGRLRVTQSALQAGKENEFLTAVRSIPTLTGIRKRQEEIEGRKLSLPEAIELEIIEYYVNSEFKLYYEKAHEKFDDSELRSIAPELYGDGKKSYQLLKTAKDKLQAELDKRGIKTNDNRKRLPFTQVSV